MATRVREHDWSQTSLGPISTWPPTLATSVDILLLSPVPMVILWGAEGVMIYNDAYSGFAGSRHPYLLGAPVLEGWPEVADFNRRILDVCFLAGGTLTFHDQPLMLSRHGQPEDVWLDLYYSPICDETGSPAGVLALVVETTERVRTERSRQAAVEALRNSEERLTFALEAGGGVGTWDWDIPQDRIYANAQFAQLFSVDSERALAGASIGEFVAGIHPADRAWVGDKIQQCSRKGGRLRRGVSGASAPRWGALGVRPGSCLPGRGGPPDPLPGRCL